MTGMDRIPHAGFGVDGEAFAAQDPDSRPSPWPLAGPALFAGLVAALLILRGLGVLPS